MLVLIIWIIFYDFYKAKLAINFHHSIILPNFDPDKITSSNKSNVNTNDYVSNTDKTD